MTPLPFDDPLWERLTDAYSGAGLADDLASLIAEWDDELADHLLWGGLIHQESCYTGTYAAAPHLLIHAQRTEDPHVREMLTAWLGWLAVCSASTHDPFVSEEGGFAGLPTTDAHWETVADQRRLAQQMMAEAQARRSAREAAGGAPATDPEMVAKLAEFTEQAKAMLEGLTGEWAQRGDELRAMGILGPAFHGTDTDPTRADDNDLAGTLGSEPSNTMTCWNAEDPDDLPDASERARIAALGDDFRAMLPEIVRLSANVYLSTQDTELLHRYLQGVAAVLGLHHLTGLYEGLDEGMFQCATCGAPYVWLRFGDRLAYYEDRMGDGSHSVGALTSTPHHLDWSDGAPKRQDGFVIPLSDPEQLDTNEQRLMAIAAARRDGGGRVLTVHFLGSFDCKACGDRARLVSYGTHRDA